MFSLCLFVYQLAGLRQTAEPIFTKFGEKVAKDVYKDVYTRTKKSVLVLVLQVWCCVAKHGLVTLVVLKDTATFQVLFIVYLFCAWNITTVEINSGVYLLKR